MGRYAEATPLLQSIFYVREKLLSISSIHVLLVACELVACLAAHDGLDARRKREEAMAFAQVRLQNVATQVHHWHVGHTTGKTEL